MTDSYPAVSLPATLSGIESADTWWVSGSDVRRNGSSVLRLNFCPNLGRLLVGDRIGIKKTSDGAMRLYINGEDFGIAATNVTKVLCFVFLLLIGICISLDIIKCWQLYILSLKIYQT